MNESDNQLVFLDCNIDLHLYERLRQFCNQCSMTKDQVIETVIRNSKGLTLGKLVNSENKATKPLYVKIDRALYDELLSLCEETDSSTDAMIEFLLTAYLSQ